MKEILSGKLPAVLQSPTPFALEFGSGSSDSKRFHKNVERISERLQDQVEVYYVDVNKVPEIRDKYNVEELPAIILFKDGKAQDTLIGYHSEEEVQHFLVQ
ncbi:thioredoxin domain-containing protein [Desulfosporosinus orientis DSM 765]|uniref:Thioredoxin domain-containing protein n=1 Tax=Desulfosporosinus orientis (strain ATCC 19365 / DSM 765 / NCIMB 8382 / VKM B-1628 / Singapore I) TaxID=768706 RepID=G7WIE7_DESOD|nr:thioredoxin family protein [Desulfosporosinus orientis]AET68595.1 thioredoxin domain-containing protein [Desulfosporosinus orientis DSM 765]